MTNEQHLIKCVIEIYHTVKQAFCDIKRTHIIQEFWNYFWWW